MLHKNSGIYLTFCCQKVEFHLPLIQYPLQTLPPFISRHAGNKTVSARQWYEILLSLQGSLQQHSLLLENLKFLENIESCLLSYAKSFLKYCSFLPDNSESLRMVSTIAINAIIAIKSDITGELSRFSLEET